MKQQLDRSTVNLQSQNSMVRNKDRLYIVLYLRGGICKMPGKEDMYHWALLMGPKHEKPSSQGTKFHAKDLSGPWEFERVPVPLEPDMRQLVRIMVAKVVDSDRLQQVIEHVPVTQREQDPAWNCISWVKEALEAMAAERDVLGRSELEWTTVRDTAMKYCQDKRDAGRFRDSKYDLKKPATYDLLRQRETIE